MAQEIIQSIDLNTTAATQKIEGLRQDFDATTASAKKTEETFEVLNNTTNQSSAYMKQLKKEAEETSKALEEGMAAATETTKATTAATGELSKELDNVSQKAGGTGNILTKAFSGLRQIAYVLPGIGVAGILGGLSEGLIQIFQEISKGANTTVDDVKNLTDVLSKAADQTASATIDVEKMNAEFKNSSSVEDRKKALDDYNKKFGETIGYANDFNDAEKRLADKTADYVKAMGYRAQADAAYGLQKAALAEATKASVEGETGLLAKAQAAIQLYFGGTGNAAETLLASNQKIVKSNLDTADSYAKIAQKAEDAFNAIKTADGGGTNKPSTRKDNSLEEQKKYIEESQKIASDAEDKEIINENLKYEKIYKDLVTFHHSTEELTEQHEENIDAIHQKYDDARQKAIKDAFDKFNIELTKQNETGLNSLLKSEDSYFAKSDQLGKTGREKEIDAENAKYQALVDQAMLYGQDITKLQEQNRKNLQTINQKYDEQDLQQSLRDKLADDKAALTDRTLSYDAKKAILDKETSDVQTAYDKQAISYKQYVATLAQIAKSEKQIALERTELQAQVGEAVGTLLTDLSKAVGENTEEGKDIAVAGAIVSTIAGAIGVFTKTSGAYPAPYGEILGALAAASVLASGYAQIHQLESVEIPGGSGSSSNSSSSLGSFSSSFSAPTIPQSTTTTNLSADSIAQVNQANNKPIRAYVLESEITDSQETVSNYRNASRIGG